MNTVIVTPTFTLDYERCKRLVDSVERHVTGIQKHVLIVDAADRDRFADLERGRVELVTKESCLELKFRRFPLQKKWWVSRSTIPFRGWILQQVVKLAYAYNSDADAVVFADSDVMFVDDFDCARLWNGKALRFFRAQRRLHQYTDNRHVNWYDHGVRVLGLDPDYRQTGAYIAQLNAMKPSVVRAMCHKIEYINKCSWQRFLLNCLDFSEFVLYGLHVESSPHALENHYFDDQQLCHSSWFYQIENQRDVEHFLKRRKPLQAAVHLQSNLKKDFGKLLDERFMARQAIA